MGYALRRSGSGPNMRRFEENGKRIAKLQME
jgi:hypothetical protein